MTSSPVRIGFWAGLGVFCVVAGISYFLHSPHQIDWGRALTDGIVVFLTIWLVLRSKKRTEELL